MKFPAFLFSPQMKTSTSNVLFFRPFFFFFFAEEGTKKGSVKWTCLNILCNLCYKSMNKPEGNGEKSGFQLKCLFNRSLIFIPFILLFISKSWLCKTLYKHVSIVSNVIFQTLLTRYLSSSSKLLSKIHSNQFPKNNGSSFLYQ